MPDLDATILSKALDWLWIILSFGFVIVFRKLFQHDELLAEQGTTLALVEQGARQRDHQRKEDKLLTTQQRAEMLAHIDSNHKIVMRKLETLDK